MEPNLSMQAAAVLLGLGALGGLVMAGVRFSGAPRPPSWLAMLHGVLAAAGLTLLIYAAVTTGIPRLAQFSLGLLVLAGLGGTAINLLYHSKMLPLPQVMDRWARACRGGRIFSVAGERFQIGAGHVNIFRLRRAMA